MELCQTPYEEHSFNKTLENQIQSHIKKIVHPNEVWFITEMQVYESSKSIDVINHNRMKKKSHMIISMYAEKVFDKILYSILIQKKQYTK